MKNSFNESPNSIEEYQEVLAECKKIIEADRRVFKTLKVIATVLSPLVVMAIVWSTQLITRVEARSYDKEAVARVNRLTKEKLQGLKHDISNVKDMIKEANEHQKEKMDLLIQLVKEKKE